VTQEQVESQLSAMFDGELPAAECELLSRRIDRDENLRARWSRYAVIGAAMRSEPVATARRGFASRISAALDASEGRISAHSPVSSSLRKRTLWNTALAASMVAAVAGVSIGMLRNSAPTGNATVARSAPPVQPALTSVVANATGVAGGDAVGPMPVTLRNVAGNGEPRNPYTTPVNQANSNIGLRTQLADFIVAHSEYSTPLMRRSLLSALVSSEDVAEPLAPNAGAVNAGKVNASPASSSSGR
jgi:sigma-E factor negative regulatory protein RseA